MQFHLINKDKKDKYNALNKSHSTSYSEVKIGRTVYYVTSVFTGEKDLGSTLEKLAAKHVLNEINGKTNKMLHT